MEEPPRVTLEADRVLNRYEEESEILAVLTKRVDAKDRINGLTEHQGRTVRVLVLLRNPVQSFEPPRRLS
jgi:hypothetical protein